jgi:anti-sigma factor RsiW
MNRISCDSLDDFLAGELAADCRAEFEVHLVDCPACRAEVAVWESLCRTLKASTGRLEAPPADLLSRVERAPSLTVHKAAKSGRSWRVAALIAVSLLAAALFSEVLRPALRPDAEHARPKAIVAATIPKSVPNPVPNPVPKPVLKRAPTRPLIEIRGKVIGVSIDIGNPNVTVVWVYPEAGGAETEK